MDALFLYQPLAPRVRLLMLDNVYLERCIARSSENYLELESHEVYAPGDWQDGVKGCIKKEGFEEGIPVWKVFIFHYWKGAKGPLGPKWTLSPIDYGSFDSSEKNNFVG